MLEQAFGFNDTNNLSVILFNWINKSSSHEHTLEHMESTGTKIMISGPIVCQLCNRRSLKMNFPFLKLSTVFTLPVYYRNKGFKACLELFWNING